MKGDFYMGKNVRIFIEDGNVFIEFEDGSIDLLENYIYLSYLKE